MSFSLLVLVSPGSLHALTWMGEAEEAAPPEGILPPLSIRAGLATLTADKTRWRNELRPHLTEGEWRCVSHRGSALTRIATKEALALALQVDAGALEIGCGPGLPGRRIPKVILEGREVALELTLSHHGRFQGWAFRAP